MWAEVEVFVKDHSKIASIYCWVSFNTQKLYWKHRKIFAPLPFIPNEEEFRFIWVQFQFICRHPWLDRSQAWLQTIQCCSRVAWWKGNIQLAIISIEMMRDSMSGDQAAKWSGIESKRQRTKNWPLGNSKKERSDLEDRQLPSLILWVLPAKYDLNQSSAFPLTPNQLPSLLRRIVWSIVSKAAERSSRVNAVTLPSSIDERISLWILRRAVKRSIIYQQQSNSSESGKVGKYAPLPHIWSILHPWNSIPEDRGQIPCIGNSWGLNLLCFLSDKAPLPAQLVICISIGPVLYSAYKCASPQGRLVPPPQESWLTLLCDVRSALPASLSHSVQLVETHQINKRLPEPVCNASRVQRHH